MKHALPYATLIACTLAYVGMMGSLCGYFTI